MDEPKTNSRTILCECGHPLNHHSFGAGECYKYARRTEKRKNHFGKVVKVRCAYSCICKKFRNPDAQRPGVDNG